MTILISATDPLSFVFKKTGGAKMIMRIAVWRDPGTPNQTKIHTLFVGSAKKKVEGPIVLPPLIAGAYQIVARIIIEEGNSGDYDYVATMNGGQFGAGKGDVNTSLEIDADTFLHREDVKVS